MKHSKILLLSDHREWIDYFNQLPPSFQDVYMTYNYYALAEKYGYGKAHCFIIEDDGKFAYYPFLLNSINALGFNLNDNYFDIQGAYGYNGVAYNSLDESFILLFQNTFKDYIYDSHIIAEFTRFNPILKNHYFSEWLSVIHTMDNVYVDLTKHNLENESYEYSTRKNIKKAKSYSLKGFSLNADTLSDAYLNEFTKIYHHTLNRNSASNYYYFDNNFFKDIITNVDDNCILYFVSYHDTIIAAELVLCGSEIAYSYLGGTLSEFFYLRPNDFLKDFIIKDLRNRGLVVFCLGGGSDGVLKFKKSFAKNNVTPFYIGTMIHNTSIYFEVVHQWESLNADRKNEFGSYFLKYRY
jgi:hypothetical protein